MVPLLIFVFWVVLIVFVNVSFLPYHKFLEICFISVLLPTFYRMFSISPIFFPLYLVTPNYRP
jgi:hypothetical protein